MKAWQEPTGTIRDVCQGDPSLSYHPDIAKLYSTDVPSGTVGGATLIAGVWTNPLPPVPYVPTAAEIAVTVATSLSAVKVVLTAQIDDAVIAIYSRPMTLSEEYKARESAALAYKAAGYTGVVPARLISFATSAGLTATAAADSVLALALQLRTALDSLSDLRVRKFEVQNSTTESAARLIHTDIMAKIAVIAKSLL